MTKLKIKKYTHIDLEYETVEDAIAILEKYKGLGAELGNHDHGNTLVTWHIEETDKEYSERLKNKAKEKVRREEAKLQDRKALYIRLHEEFGNDTT